jgi:hypothetical protein
MAYKCSKCWTDIDLWSGLGCDVFDNNTGIIGWDSYHNYSIVVVDLCSWTRQTHEFGYPSKKYFTTIDLGNSKFSACRDLTQIYREKL